MKNHYPKLTINVSDTTDLRPPESSWTIVEDVKEPQGSLIIQLAEIIRNPNEYQSEAKNFLEQAKVIAPTFLGERHLQALIAIQDQIPVCWRPYSLFFPGTIWNGWRDKPFFMSFTLLHPIIRNAGTFLAVPYIHWKWHYDEERKEFTHHSWEVGYGQISGSSFFMHKDVIVLLSSEYDEWLSNLNPQAFLDQEL